jgi:hypothetical protein
MGNSVVVMNERTFGGFVRANRRATGGKPLGNKTHLGDLIITAMIKQIILEACWADEKPCLGVL